MKDKTNDIKGGKTAPYRQAWIWRAAWNDARFNLGRIGLFMASIVIGVAALTAINGFNDNLQNDINQQAKRLLGADLAVENDEYEAGIMDTTLAFLDSLAEDAARDARFASMVYFPKSQGSRLVRAVAMEGGFPFYGTIETTAGSDIAAFRQGDGVMIDQPLAAQFDVAIGDSLRLGEGSYRISAIVGRFPGSADIQAAISPSVYLPYEKLDETGLIQYGSRVEYNRYYKLAEQDLDPIIERLKPLREQYGFSWDTVEEERDDTSRGFQNLNRYFNLLGFVALILGCVGVSSSIFVYMREKRSSAAILRCIGASGWQIFWIFFVQAASMGVAGSLLGVAAGVGVQYLIPLVAGEFLPIDVTISLSWQAVFTGVAVGLVISALFSILPLANIRLVSPLEILRNAGADARRSRFRTVIISLIVIFPLLFAVYLTRSWANGAAFYLGLAAAFTLLYFISKGLMWFVRRSMPRQTKVMWRLGFSNLFRPNNQTSVLVIVIGLGAFLVSTMALMQNSLLNQVEFAGSGERSNTVLFDIQPYQLDETLNLVKQYDLPVQQIVPIVTTRINSLKGRPTAEWAEDTTADLSTWRLTREYRVTYRDSLISSETILQGEFENATVEEGDSVFISISEDMSEDLNLRLNDEIVFDVQGVPISTYVGSVRKVDWRRIQTNFMVVFPAGVLENAPQFFVALTRIGDPQKAAEFQNELVSRQPNVSMIDLTLILDTLDEIFDKVAFVISFMALFSIITGMLALSAAVINSKFARLKENAMLRTIGALRKQVVGMTLVEYGYLGGFAGLAGILLALGGSWILATFFFEIAFFPDFLSMAIIWASVAVVTAFIGWLNTRSVLNRSPLEALRKEA